MTASFKTIIELLYPLIIGAGLFSSVRLMSVGTKQIRLANSLIVGLLFVLTVPMWNTYVSSLSASVLSLNWPFDRGYWLIAPLMYLYFTEVFSTGPERKLYFIHFLPFVLMLGVENFSSLDKFSLFRLSIFIWTVLTLLYMTLLAAKLFKVKNRYQQLHSSTLAIEFRWSLALLFGLMMFVAVDIGIGLYILANMPYPDSLVNSFIAIRSVFVIGIVLYTLYHKITIKQPLDLFIDPHSPKNTSTLRLTEDAAQSLTLVLEQRMKDPALFSTPNLSLTDLAEKLSVTTHQLSEVLNTHMRTSFYQYVNTKRIDYAKKLLSEAPSKPIVDIALLCGYGSKTTFYDNFKKISGQTPKQFRVAALS